MAVNSKLPWLTQEKRTAVVVGLEEEPWTAFGIETGCFVEA